MKKRIINLLLLITLVSGVCVVSGKPVWAAEGGAVQREGVNSFYEDEPAPSSSSSEEPKTEPTSEPEPEPSSSSAEPVVTKPAGKYPSTGELIQTGAAVSGATLVLAFLLIVLWRRKKEKEGREER
jgi:LPXTG-motif cell wall-anchored protein